jgi:hypothetical protein
VFLILAAKAQATVWKVHRSPHGAITSLEKKRMAPSAEPLGSG